MATTQDEHEIHRMQGEDGCAHPDGDVDQRADVELAAAAQPEDTADSALEAFAKHANWGILHPEDNERFEKLMKLATEAKWAPTELEARLIGHGIPEAMAQELRRKYWNRRRPLPVVGTTRREMDQQIAEMNAKLTRR